MRNAQAMRWASDRGPASVPPEKVARRAVPPAEKGGSLDDGWWGFGATGYEKDDTSFYANCTQGWNYLRGDCKIMQSFDIGAPAEGRPHSHGGRAAPLHASCCGQASTRGPSRSTSGSTRPTRCRRCTATHAPLHRRLSLPLPAASPRRRHHHPTAATTNPPPPHPQAPLLFKPFYAGAHGAWSAGYWAKTWVLYPLPDLKLPSSIDSPQHQLCAFSGMFC